MTDESQQNQISLNKTSQIGQSMDEWDIEDKKKLAAVVNEIAMTQRKSKEDLDAKVVLRQWQRKFINRFTVDQLIYALDKHIEQNEWFPTVKNIIDILEPAAPKITQAAYIQACREYAEGGYNQFTDAYDIKRAYEAQEKEGVKSHAIECEKVKSIASSAIKRIA